MPLDSILVSVAVASMFVIFAGVMIWADFQSSPEQREMLSRAKRRSF